MKERAKKRLVYKHADFSEEGGLKLSAALAAALKAKPTIGERRESLALGGEGSIWRLIGEYEVSDHFVFGVLMRYMPGLHPACLVDDVRARAITVKQLAVPKTDDGKAQELIEGMLYFACIDNHLTLVQSSALRSLHLERHLNWLLMKGKVMAETNTLRLLDQPKVTAAALLKEREVKSLDITGDLVPADEPDGSGAEAKVRVTQESVDIHRNAPSERMWGFIKSLMAEDKAAKLDIEQLAGANIEYSLSVRYNRTTTDGGHKMLNTLGAALRHADGVETKIDLVGGGTIHGNDLRLQSGFTIDTFDGIPATTEVWGELRQWLAEALKTGQILA